MEESFIHNTHSALSLSPTSPLSPKPYEARYGAEYRFFEILVNMVNAVNVVNVVNMVFGAFSSCFLFFLPTICW